MSKKNMFIIILILAMLVTSGFLIASTSFSHFRVKYRKLYGRECKGYRRVDIPCPPRKKGDYREKTHCYLCGQELCSPKYCN